ncbi:MAG: hypothetical protein JRF07_08855, partial [Deltaproteobacteria bacterium]|nr:hypothetical protein [Deltaproteobacteria bacterium]
DKILKTCPVVYVPPLYDITFVELLINKETLVPFDFYFEELVQKVAGQARQVPVAFLVPGDLTFFSPFQPLVDQFGNQAVVVPGVGAVNAASALLKKTLDLPGVCNRTILASPRTLGEGPGAPTMQDLAAPGVSLIIYMNNMPLDELVTQLRQGYQQNVPIALAHRIGLPDEEILIGSLDDIINKAHQRDYFSLNGPGKRPALTLVLVGESLAAITDGSWWNYRRDHIWKVDQNG